MRTIVPFVLTLALYAQSPRPAPAQQIELLEKKIADGREAPRDRITLLNLYVDARDVEGRRRHILWLTEHRPEMAEFRTSRYGNPTFDMRPANSLPDAVGFDLAAELWRAHVAPPDASPKVIANAAYFFRFADRDYALSILREAAASHPRDVDIAKTRGLLDVLSLGGLVDGPVNSLHSDEHARLLPAAKESREDVDSSHDATFLGAAGVALTENAFMLDIRFQDFPALGGDDALDVAEKWLLRAAELDPNNKDIKPALARVYERQSAQAADPRWKLRLLRKSNDQAPNPQTFSRMALAEFEAGEDEAAIRDARIMLQKTPVPVNYTQAAHTILGREALARGDIETAKTELLASIPNVPRAGPPDVALAQDLLATGEHGVVIQYLERFNDLWEFNEGTVDHWIRLVRIGSPNAFAPFRPGGMDSFGKKVKLPDGFADKLVAIHFRNAGCKSCAEQFEVLKNSAAVKSGVVALLSIDQADGNPATQFLEIESYPTVVLLSRDSAVRRVIIGKRPETELRSSIESFANLTTQPQRLPAPVPTGPFSWKPVAGAESYVVQWDQRDDKGWLSDRDDHLVRVIPTQESSVTLDPALGETNPGTIRWRVFAVSRAGAGSMSEWREMSAVRP